MRKSLLRHLLPLYISAIVLVVTLGSVTVFWSMRSILLEQEQASFRNRVELIAALLEREQHADPSEMVRRAREYAGMVGDSVEPIPQSELEAETPQRDAPQFGSSTLHIRLRVHAQESSVILRFSRSLTNVRARLQSLFVPIAVFAFIFAIFTAAVSVYAARRIVRSISSLQNAAHRYARGEFDFRVEIQEPAELRAFASTLHGMAGQLKERISTINNQRRESELILGSMVEGIVVLEDNMHIRMLNEAAANFLGCRIEQARGSPFQSTTDSDDLTEAAEQASDLGQPLERSVTVHRGEPHHLQVHISPLKTGPGKRPKLLLVMNDITRIKRLEDMRRDFVANVSHELKTPITSIRGFVETLLDDHQADEQQRRHFLKIVLRHAGRLQGILEDLLSLSRLEQAEGDIPTEPLSLRTLSAHVREAVATRATDKGVHIIESYSGPDTASLNANLMEQALVNLVDNAVKYGNTHSKVTLQFDNTRHKLTISVNNQGPVIPDEALSRIFERFYRVDKARSRSLGGTGLGLAIVKHIAIVHGGNVAVESTPSEGTTFRMIIPAGEPRKTQNSSNNETSPGVVSPGAASPGAGPSDKQVQQDLYAPDQRAKQGPE